MTGKRPVLDELIAQILIDVQMKRRQDMENLMKMKPWCTQNNGDCWTCSLVSYGRDCENNPVPKFPIGIYRVYESDLVGWTVETLTEALEEPMAAVGVEVEAHPRESGPESLLVIADMSPADEELFRMTVRGIAEHIVIAGSIGKEQEENIDT